MRIAEKISVSGGAATVYGLIGYYLQPTPDFYFRLIWVGLAIIVGAAIIAAVAMTK